MTSVFQKDDLAAGLMFCDPRSQNMQLAYYAAAAATFKGHLKAFQRPLNGLKKPLEGLTRVLRILNTLEQTL